MTNQEAIEQFEERLKTWDEMGETPDVKDYLEAMRLAIEALNSPTPMSGTSDLISRQAVIEAFCDASIPVIADDGRGTFQVDYIKTIRSIPSASQSDWIPCSERLPEERGTYLVTQEVHFVPDHVDETDHYRGVGLGRYSPQFGWLDCEEVYAWRPLPAPYRLGDTYAP